MPYYCKWIEETTLGEVKCQTERVGENPSPVPASTPIEEIKPSDVECRSVEIPIPSPSSNRSGKPLLVYGDLYTLALYRDNGTRACYSRVPVYMCLDDLLPYNETRRNIPFVCFQLGFTPSIPFPPAACLPVHHFTDPVNDEYERLFSVSEPMACVHGEEHDGLSTNGANLNTVTTIAPKYSYKSSQITFPITTRASDSTNAQFTTIGSGSQRIIVDLSCSSKGSFYMRANRITLGVDGENPFKDLGRAEFRDGSCEAQGEDYTIVSLNFYVPNPAELRQLTWEMEFSRRNYTGGDAMLEWEIVKMKLDDDGLLLPIKDVVWTGSSGAVVITFEQIRDYRCYKAVLSVEAMRLAPFVPAGAVPSEKGMWVWWGLYQKYIFRKDFYPNLSPNRVTKQTI